jgi:hypothetical protein
MAIPIVSEIIAFIGHILSVMPKSVKYIIYLAILFAVLSVIPLFLHMTGIHCDSGKNIRTTSLFSIYDNYQISRLSKEDIYNITNYKARVNPNLLGIGDKITCAVLLRYDHTSFFTDYYAVCDRNDTISNNTDCVHALRIVNYKGLFNSDPKCYTCDDKRPVEFIAPNEGLHDQYCFSEAYPNNASECPDLDNCDIPYGYYFNNVTGYFVCSDLSVCGANGTNKLVFDVDVKLDTLGAKRMYGSSIGEDDYNNVIQFKCYGNSLDPQLTFMGVPIFDYRLWLLMTILGAMFFYYMYYR